MENILDDIANEREYQKLKWGTLVDDTINRPMDFVGYIAHHSTRWFNGGFAPYSESTLQNYRQEMIKVAALAMAAIESVDKIIDGTINRPDVKATA
jgi:hypothetical protein